MVARLCVEGGEHSRPVSNADNSVTGRCHGVDRAFRIHVEVAVIVDDPDVPVLLENVVQRGTPFRWLVHLEAPDHTPLQQLEYGCLDLVHHGKGNGPGVVDSKWHSTVLQLDGHWGHIHLPQLTLAVIEDVTVDRQ